MTWSDCLCQHVFPIKLVLEIEKTMSRSRSQNQNDSDQFTLLPNAQGFVYKKQKYSAKIKGEYKLTLKQYYAIFHLFSAPQYTMYGKDLKRSIEDSLGIPLDDHPMKSTILKSSQRRKRVLSRALLESLDNELDRINLDTDAHQQDEPPLSDILQETNSRFPRKNQNTHYHRKNTIIRDGKVIVTLPGSISSYFVKSKKVAVANLFGTLIRSTGKSGSYYLSL